MKSLDSSSRFDLLLDRRDDRPVSEGQPRRLNPLGDLLKQLAELRQRHVPFNAVNTDVERDIQIDIPGLAKVDASGKTALNFDGVHLSVGGFIAHGGDNTRRGRQSRAEGRGISAVR